MAFYVQYNISGNITATVMSFDIQPPVNPRQITLAEFMDLTGMQVNTQNKTIVDLP